MTSNTKTYLFWAAICLGGGKLATLLGGIDHFFGDDRDVAPRATEIVRQAADADPERPAVAAINERIMILEAAASRGAAADPGALAELRQGVGKLQEAGSKRYASLLDRMVERIDRLSQRKGCNVAKAPADAQVVLYGLYQGEGVSTVSVGGESVTTTTATVEIEEGSKPLYLVLSSHNPVLWVLKGAVGRVRHVAAFSVVGTPDGDSATGVSGLNGSLVSTPRPGACFDGYLTQAPANLPTDHRLLAGLERKLDASAAAQTASIVHLPSGTATRSAPPKSRSQALAALPPGYHAERWITAVQRYPAGLVPIDPATVASPYPAAAYKILPAEFGSAQQNRR